MSSHFSSSIRFAVALGCDSFALLLISLRISFAHLQPLAMEIPMRSPTGIAILSTHLANFAYPVLFSSHDLHLFLYFLQKVSHSEQVHHQSSNSFHFMIDPHLILPQIYLCHCTSSEIRICWNRVHMFCSCYCHICLTH